MRPKRFWLPEGRPFEIPVEWWTEAGMDRFYLGPDVSYRGRLHLNSKVVLMADIELPSMEHRKLSHGPLDRDRMVSVLWSIAERAEICPIAVTKMTSGNYRYRLHDGAHRFHASAAVCFTHIPALVVFR
jgi:hypothetical protein